MYCSGASKRPRSRNICQHFIKSRRRCRSMYDH